MSLERSRIHTTLTRLQKVAADNGFDLEREATDGWLAFASSQTRMTIWLGAVDDAFVLACSRDDVFDGVGKPFADVPDGAVAARSVADIPALHVLVRRAFQLSRALPVEPLHVFVAKTRDLPRATEVERLVIQRVGQDVFRAGLLDYWDSRCAVTGLGVVDVLRSSHIKPWAACDTDEERLDVYNGLLLAPHLDALFDRGLITLDDDGDLVAAGELDTYALALLGITQLLRLIRIDDAHRHYLNWHRDHVFRGR